MKSIAGTIKVKDLDIAQIRRDTVEYQTFLKNGGDSRASKVRDMRSGASEVKLPSDCRNWKGGTKVTVTED